jgi:uncharacterized protein (DUF885 family)
MKNLIKFLLVSLLLFSCATKQYTPEQRAAETQKLNKLLDGFFEAGIARYPMWQTYLGLKTNYDKLNNGTEEFALEGMKISKKNLAEMEDKIDYDALTEQGKISYRLFKQNVEDGEEGWKWRHHYYPLNQMYGYHSNIPSFMINTHRVSTEKDAKDYIARIYEVKRVFKEAMVDNLKQKELGIIPPAFVFDKVIDDSKNIIKGRPFDKTKNDSPLMEDFRKKVKGLKLSKKKSRILIKDMEKALLTALKPSYDDLIVYMTDLQKVAKTSHGAWSLPNGKEYYRWRLKQMTTTDMDPDEIHEFGLKEIDRIHGEMREIMKKVKFKGTLQEFFTYMKESKKFYYPQTKKGRNAYLTESKKIIAKMKATLPKMFKTFPKADLEVKAVEAYREKSAGIAFYQGPSLYGNRPGIYYVNLYKMADNPKYEMEALAYHEALPGHHMQIAIKTELEALPKFRRTGGFTAYSEGWGLYSERLPKEFGFYKDPYSDFGRLSMELWRAARLVTDTGLHAKKWSREKGIEYLTNNTPAGDLEIMKGIERYIVMPGQATTYKIGMTKILELREKAKNKLKDKFDIRDFHDVVLKSGALPLYILEEQVDEWINL